MDNFSDSEFTLVLHVSHLKEQKKKIENVIEYHQEYQGEIKNPLKKKKKIVTWSKEKTKVKAILN